MCFCISVLSLTQLVENLSEWVQLCHSDGFKDWKEVGLMQIVNRGSPY